MARSSSEHDEVIDWRTTQTWFTHETLFLRIAKPLVRLFYYPQVKIEKIGFDENIPQGPAIMVSNHIGNDDAPLLGICFPKGRHIYFMAKTQLFGKLSWVYRHLGGFPINRGEPDAWAFEHVGRILAAGQICMIFAEGTRNGPKKVALRKAKTGAVRLAIRYQVPILPCAILGPEELYTKRFKGWRPITVRIVLGELIDIPALMPEDPSSQLVYRELTNLVMYRLAQLLPEENRGVYAEEPELKILGQTALSLLGA